MPVISHLPTNLAIKLYLNVGNRSRSQRIFHQTSTALVASIVKLVFLRHSFKVVNGGLLLDIVNNRPSYKPLLTISNHHSCVDDVALFGKFLPYNILLDADKLRWSGTAVDICFINKLHELFFKSGKGVPLWRRVRDPKTQQDILPGLGVDQPSMDFCVDLLNAGRWVHFFPQGRIILPCERGYEEDIKIRWGIGRLLADSIVDPTIIPIWHCGIDDLNPVKPPYFRNTLQRILGPRRGVTVFVGAPFEAGNLHQRTANQSGRSALHEKLTSDVQKALYALKPLAEAEHAAHLASLN